MKNYYEIFFMKKGTFSKERLQKYYDKFLKHFDEEYERIKKDKVKLELHKSFKENVKEAYNILSDDEKRARYDKELDEFEEKRKSSELKKSMQPEWCIDKYNYSLIEKVKFVRKKYPDAFFNPYTYLDDNTKRSVKFRQKGEIRYTKNDSDKDNTLYQYEVYAISTKNPVVKKYDVVTSLIRYSEIAKNPKYAKAVYEGLFSEENLDESKKRNFGYLGKIIDMENDEYGLDYDAEDFTAAVRFKAKIKDNVDRLKGVKNTPFTRLKRILRKFDKNKELDER